MPSSPQKVPEKKVVFITVSRYRETSCLPCAVKVGNPRVILIDFLSWRESLRTQTHGLR